MMRRQPLQLKITYDILKQIFKNLGRTIVQMYCILTRSAVVVPSQNHRCGAV
jgi:hypothetical protein